MEERKAKEEEADREKMREETEKELMKRQDIDIKDVEFEEQASDF